MAYDKFTTLTSAAVPLPIENVDTDQIIPARFLKATERVGFVLNQSTYSGKILVGGKNFGSGSSREHAAWAVYDHGFRCVISSFFADIFRNNCLNIGVLPVQVSPAFLEEIFKSIEKDPATTLEVNLRNQTVSLLATGTTESFAINPYKKENMQNGYDDIDYLLNLKDSIQDFAQNTPL
jgi:3-isopropylmalate/(R)-2-methylmalate dehydratase small subunit